MVQSAAADWLLLKKGMSDRLLAANDKAAALAQDKSKQGHEGN